MVAFSGPGRGRLPAAGRGQQSTVSHPAQEALGVFCDPGNRKRVKKRLFENSQRSPNSTLVIDSGGKCPVRARAGMQETHFQRPTEKRMLRINVKLFEALQALLSRTFSKVGHVVQELCMLGGRYRSPGWEVVASGAAPNCDSRNSEGARLVEM